MILPPLVETHVYFFVGLNMFMVPIKLENFKFSPYLVLIVFFSPYKKYLHVILVHAKTKSV